MLSVIIPNFNGVSLFKIYMQANLDVLSAIPKAELIVVDDASTDDSAAVLAREYPAVRLVRHTRQTGFSGACNSGAAAATQPILFFLNSDIQIKTLDIVKIQDYLNRADIFSVAAKLCRLSEQNINEAITMAYFKGGWLTTRMHLRFEPSFVPVEGMPIFWSCGGAFFVRKDRFFALGQFDAILNPFYCEDMELSYRAWKQGLASVYSEACVCDHGHVGTINQVFSQKYICQIAARNHIIAMLKHISDPWFLIALFGSFLSKALTFQVRDTMGLVMALKHLGAILRYRRETRAVITDREIFAITHAALKLPRAYRGK